MALVLHLYALHVCFTPISSSSPLLIIPPTPGGQG